MAIKKFDVERFRELVINQSDKDWTDFTSKNTIIFGSLIEDGFDWGYDDWTSYTMSSQALTLVRARLKRKIENRFFSRELGILPPEAFRRGLVSHMEDIVDSKGYLYEQAFQGLDFSYEEKDSMVKREVKSEFPQSLLNNETHDYASEGEVEAYERVTAKAALPGLIDFYSAIAEPDAIVLKHIDKHCFSQLLSRNF